MKTIFETCTPRKEVLSGELKESIFAARLYDVVTGNAASVYRQPEVFFQNTFPTSGLKTLLKESLGRLSGKEADNNSVIRLETSFGGGKTHNLIALYHLATHGASIQSPLSSFIDSQLLPDQPVSYTAGVVGTDLDVANGVNHGEITTYTLWGEIAYQLGGVLAYRLLEESDKKKIAPGTQVWERIIGNQPALIMIDELARYLRTTKGLDQKVGDSTLAQQTVAFLMSLMEFAVSKENVVFVFTLADPKDSFSAETEEIIKELDEAKKTSARQELVLTPTEETEIAAIVNHRLFQTIDNQAGLEIAREYIQFYRSLQDVDLPIYATRAEYQQDMEKSYPFHPELLKTLNRKTSTIPNFQKTRGALRLLAMAIRNLWEKCEKDVYFIHPHHLDLSYRGIAEDLTSRLERPRYKSVIEADIYSSTKGYQSHAQEIDEEFAAADKPPYASRLATTIFLHSLTQGVATGIKTEELHVSVLQPGQEPGLMNKGLDDLLKSCWYLEADINRLRFKTEPVLNKIINDEMMAVGSVHAKNKLDAQINKTWKKGIFHVDYFPSEASEVEDKPDKPRLAIIHYDTVLIKSDTEEPPEVLLQIFDHAGTAEGFRKYRNHLLFLVADKDLFENMMNISRKCIAIKSILEDVDRFKELTDDQKTQLKEMYESSDLSLRIAITRCYRYLFYPSIDAPRKYSNLNREILPPQEQGEVQKDQCLVILGILKRLEKVLTQEEKPLSAFYVKSKVMPLGKEQISTEDLRRSFAQQVGLKMLLDINQLKTTIKNGIDNNVWVYYDEDEDLGYTSSSPRKPMIRFEQSVFLLTPEEAERRKIKLLMDKEPENKCPVCNQLVDNCICEPGDNGDDNGKPLQLEAEGSPGQALQSIADHCRDHSIDTIKELTLSIEGKGEEVISHIKGLGLAIPQFGKGDYSIKQSIVGEFEDSGSIRIDFSGSWKKYQRLKTLSESLGDTSNILVTMSVHGSFTEGLSVSSSQFSSMKDTLSSLGLGKLKAKGRAMDP